MLIAYKDRMINIGKPIQVYRNLHKPGVVYSIRQQGRVVAYSSEVALTGCTMHVNFNAYRKIQVTRVREVHAWVEGYLTQMHFYHDKIFSYNPYKYPYFYDIHSLEPVTKAPYVLFDTKGAHY